MAYTVNFSKQAFKGLEKIHEPFYLAIKEAIFGSFGKPTATRLQKAKR